METITVPPHVYTLIGALIIANLGSVGTLIVFIFRAGAFVAKTNHGIETANAVATRAHERIDLILTKT